MKKDKEQDIELEIDKELFLKIAQLAHEKDITFNQMCGQILKNSMDEMNK